MEVTGSTGYFRKELLVKSVRYCCKRRYLNLKNRNIQWKILAWHPVQKMVVRQQLCVQSKNYAALFLCNRISDFNRHQGENMSQSSLHVGKAVLLGHSQWVRSMGDLWGYWQLRLKEGSRLNSMITNETNRHLWNGRKYFASHSIHIRG